MKNRYDKEHPLHDLEGWIVFYGQQAQRLEDDESMAEVFQASCETGELLLELKTRREMAVTPPENHLWTDEQVATMKAKGIITEDKPETTPTNKCSYCGNPIKIEDGGICSDCIPF